MGISLDISDSGREGCMVCTLTVTCEPKHWRGATRIAIEEARRLQRYGVTPGEFERYKKAILRDSAQLAEQVSATEGHIHTHTHRWYLTPYRMLRIWLQRYVHVWSVCFCVLLG